MLYRLGLHAPMIAPSSFIEESASIIGQVILEEESSIWCQAVLRGDNEPIRVGPRSNVQDGALLHTDPGAPLTIEAGVSVGHGAVLHGCTVGAGSLIGIRAVVLNHAVIGKNCLIGANALITEGKQIPDGSLVIGSPGRVIRALTAEEIAGLQANAAVYVRRAEEFRRTCFPLDAPSPENP
ncbi:MAG: gamma carbonic anhydrase family protein [Ferrovum sp.]|nr:gamma carbonic anhydrase family protein [Ferrovum sp.]NDU87849.1 gamma carbonic anhydrase family protein [Ferrovum sp.]